MHTRIQEWFKSGLRIRHGLTRGTDLKLLAVEVVAGSVVTGVIQLYRHLHNICLNCRGSISRTLRGGLVLRDGLILKVGLY